MKKILVMLFVFFLVGSLLISLNGCGTTGGGDTRSWQLVGAIGFSGTTEVQDLDLAIDSAETPYVFFANSDYSTSPIPTVMKFSNGNWTLVGARGCGLTDGSDYVPGNLALSVYNNVPYVIIGTSTEALAASFEGSAWRSLGSPSSSAEATCPSIAVDGREIHCAYQTLNEVLYPSTPAMASYYDSASGNWYQLGTNPLSDNGASGEDLITRNGVNFLTFSAYEPGGITVLSNSSGNWQLIGANCGVSNTDSVWPSIAVDSGLTPYVAYTATDSTLHVKVLFVSKYNGATWEVVGGQKISSGASDSPSLCFAADNTLYVAYPDASVSGEATVKKWNGSNWTTVGTAGFSEPIHEGNYRLISLAISPNGVPYVAVVGCVTGLTQPRLSVYKFE
jgi:hypothetical protein